MWATRCLLFCLLASTVAVNGTVRAEDVDPFQKMDEQRAKERRQRDAREGGKSSPLPEAGSSPPFRDGVYDRQTGADGGKQLAGPIAATPVEREALPPLEPPAPALPPGPSAAPQPGGSRAATPAAAVPASPALPTGIWQSIDADEVAKAVSALDLPPRSPALAGLWRRIWTSEPAQAYGGRLAAVRAEALYRSGLVGVIAASTDDAGATDVVSRGIRTRVLIGVGDRERGCADAKALSRASEAPMPLRWEMLLVTAYCAAAAGNMAEAELAAELARGQGIKAPLALAMLDAAVSGQPANVTLPKQVGLIDYRFLKLGKSPAVKDALARGEPAVAPAIAEAGDADPTERVAAAEAAARLNANSSSQLMEAYRLAGSADASGDAALQRAGLFRSVEAERTPFRKTRLVRQLMDEADRAGLQMPVAAMLASAVAPITPVPEIGWFAETAVEINLAAGDYAAARKWIEAGERTDRGEGLRHWAALVDIADPAWPGKRGEALAEVERVALRGRLSSGAMHHLVTVLDALDYLIPIPLWEAASRTPQPTTGHLPATGVLSQLQEASKKRDMARTVILSLATLGSAAADKSNIIALGDTIRALRRAGLETEARRLALEAVLPGWPRRTGH